MLEQPLYVWSEVGLQQAPELLPRQGLQPWLAAPDYALGRPAPAPAPGAFLDPVDLAARDQAVPLVREAAATARAPPLRLCPPLQDSLGHTASKVCIQPTP